MHKRSQGSKNWEKRQKTKREKIKKLGSRAIFRTSRWNTEEDRDREWESIKNQVELVHWEAYVCVFVHRGSKVSSSLYPIQKLSY